jgi:hypothetical protein
VSSQEAQSDHLCVSFRRLNLTTRRVAVYQRDLRHIYLYMPPLNSHIPLIIRNLRSWYLTKSYKMTERLTAARLEYCYPYECGIGSWVRVPTRDLSPETLAILGKWRDQTVMHHIPHFHTKGYMHWIFRGKSTIGTSFRLLFLLYTISF